MHPFGGTPICPRCSKVVYAAEQIMGPGRKLYHKPCLTCTTCRKRLDSYSLVEHDEEPFCKTCHVKNFGTRDLRHANLPDRDDVLVSPPTSPIRAGAALPTPSRSPPPTAPALPPRKTVSTSAVDPPRNTVPLFRPNRTYNPVRPAAAMDQPPPQDDRLAEATEEGDWEPPALHGPPSHAGRGAGGLPRTVPLDVAMTGPPRAPSPVKAPSASLGGAPPSGGKNTIINGRMIVPLGPISTGTRYGAALSGRTASPVAALSGRTASPVAASPNRQWGGGTPVCGKCDKTVYFAEQVKAIGKTWHRNCLRCTECNALLDSSRLTEKDGDPYCKHCYGKLYGPAGSGYALLGKAGG